MTDFERGFTFGLEVGLRAAESVSYWPRDYHAIRALIEPFARDSDGRRMAETAVQQAGSGRSPTSAVAEGQSPD